NKIGENSITMANGGCAIHESYTTPRGYTGQSINYYDIIDKKWHQHWVGSSGDMTNYLESDREDKMLQFVGKIMLANGNIILNRMTFTYSPDEMTVRQLIESSRDDGETWFPSFDGLYKKKVN
ncbi:MAG: hypothetical protein KI790_15760, partial [Cyclobacteriaceae bacterium]|nr:hypothetical protein [Cyclobacteriaceae bacterium HetDA_MAG_MS6]